MSKKKSNSMDNPEDIQHTEIAPSECLFLEKVFASLDEAVFVVQTPSRKIILCNNAVEGIFGYTREEVLGRNTSFLHVNEESYRDFDHLTLPALDKEGVYRGEYRMKRKDGSTFTSGHSITDIRDIDGKRTHVVSVVFDISYFKVLEDKLRENAAFYRNLFESSLDVIILLDKEGNVVDINPRGEHLLGYPRHELLGMNAFQHLVVPEYHHVVRGLIQNSMEGRNTFYEVHYKTKDEKIIVFDGVTVPRMSVQGEFLSTFCTLRDVTDRKEAEKQLQKSSEELRRLAMRIADVQESERLRLSQDIHDSIAGNLTSLGIALDIIGNDLPSGPCKGIKKRVKDSKILVEETLTRIRGIIGELRPPILDDYGLPATLKWYAEMFSQRTGILLTVDCPEPAERLAPAAEISLFRIVQEALTNASKHAQATKIDIRMKTLDRKLRLSVADNGKGFQPQDVKRGNRWGLMIMTERAEAAGGRLEILSSPGAGTEIIVEVPT